MRLLYHFPLCPFSRKVRILLCEKRLDFQLRFIKSWEHDVTIPGLNDTYCAPPILFDNGLIITDSNAICEYLEEEYTDYCFLGKTAKDRAEVRRLISLFDHDFYYGVTGCVLYERVIKYYTSSDPPDSSLIRTAKLNISYYLSYITELLDKYQWMAGNFFSMADIVIAAHLSVLDYLHDISWHDGGSVRDWYSLIKSRPGFKAVLQDRIAGFHPPLHYVNTEF